MPADNGYREPRELSFDDIRPSVERIYVSPRSRSMGSSMNTPEAWAQFLADAMEAALTQPVVHPRQRQPFDWHSHFRSRHRRT